MDLDKIKECLNCKRVQLQLTKREKVDSILTRLILHKYEEMNNRCDGRDRIR